MSLRFEPTCAPLLLGSLPHQNAALALAATRRATSELVAWPQLWQRGLREQFLAQSAIGFPGLVIDEASQQVFVATSATAEQIGKFALAYLENDYNATRLGENDAAGLHELLRLGPKPAGITAVKGQNLGPVSLALLLTDQNQHPLIYDPALLEAVVQFVRMRVAWQEHVLAALDVPIILCLDEPFLEMIGSPFVPIDWDDAEAHLKLVFPPSPSCHAISAGGAVDWGHLLRLGFDLVIGDVYHHGAGLLGAAETLSTYVQEGGMIGFGLVPVTPEHLAVTTATQLVEQLTRLCDELQTVGVDQRKLLRQAVITPVGALGSLTIEEAEQALRLLTETAALARQTYYGGHIGRETGG